MIIYSMPVVLQITIHDKTVGPNLWQVCFHFPLVLQLLSVCCLNKWSSRLSISMDRSHHCLTHKQYIHTYQFLHFYFKSPKQFTENSLSFSQSWDMPDSWRGKQLAQWTTLFGKAIFWAAWKCWEPLRLEIR